jgi:hypothetical protein
VTACLRQCCCHIRFELGAKTSHRLTTVPPPLLLLLP